jgi:putative lipoprotein
MIKQEESNNMNSKTKILLLFMVLFVFGDCTSEVRYSNQIINYDYRNFDGVLIYNRDSEVIIFELFRTKESGLVFVDSNLKIIKKPRNYILKDKEIIKLIRAYKRLKLSYCRIDYDKIIRVICNGIDYIRINKNHNDKVYLFDEHKHEYKYIGNDWYVKNYNVTI